VSAQHFSKVFWDCTFGSFDFLAKTFAYLATFLCGECLAHLGEDSKINMREMDSTVEG
jgi:hypothetical protein